ncbi:hypothetical protein FB561_4957 [Kribbella amoyensis]|uniref:Uncharacterized protein n=1 Tax=Kribbella amoyensis TaxID=996641 RepID=A0A561BY76_9ACTN|nr:hypothetical protein [Kribbella amoyensis]TWD83788.1 hypothetical protein FB561_4957 [Kribbella amoyensis]
MPWLRIVSVGIVVVLLGFVVRGAVDHWSDPQESRQDVIDQHAGTLRTIRGQVERAVAKTPPIDLEAAGSERCDGLRDGERPFKLDRGDPRTSTVGIVLDRQLTDPGAERGQYDFAPTTLGDLIVEAGPGHEAGKDDQEPADDLFRRTVEATAKVRYALVLRLVDVPSEDEEPRHLGYTASMLDLTRAAEVCRFSATADVGRGVIPYRYPSGASEEMRNRSKAGALRMVLLSNTLAVLEMQLNSVQRGSFELDGK